MFVESGVHTFQAAGDAVLLAPALVGLELYIHQIPVLFGAGRRLFDGLLKRVELEIVRVSDTLEAIHIRYRIRRHTDERNA